MSKVTWFNAIFYTGMIFAIGLFIVGTYGLFYRPNDTYQKQLNYYHSRMISANKLIQENDPSSRDGLRGFKRWYDTALDLERMDVPSDKLSKHQKIMALMSDCIALFGVDYPGDYHFELKDTTLIGLSVCEKLFEDIKDE